MSRTPSRRRPQPAAARLGVAAATLGVLGALGVTGPGPLTASAATDGRVTPITPGAVVLSEVSWTDWSGARDSDGDTGDWVELSAPGAAVDVSTAGLSDKDDSPYRWRFPRGTVVPAGGSLLVWLSGKDRRLGGQPHTSFGISAGDTLYLTDGLGTPLDAVETPEAGKRDVSWCRSTPTLQGTWRYCASPTPGAPNAGEAGPLLPTPTLSTTSGWYASAVTVTATTVPGATVRYTTDGSEPTASSPVLSGPLGVGSTRSVRVAAWAPGYLSSPVATGSYLIGSTAAARHRGQQVVLITMKPGDAFAHDLGIKDAKWASHVSVLGPDGVSVVDADAETDVPGQVGALLSPQKGFDVSFRSAMGTSSVDAALIPNRPTTTYRRFRLRNGGNDWWSTRLRDAVGQAIGDGGRNLTSGYAPAAVYLNGSYYGELQLREKEDETLVESQLGVDEDDVEFISDPLLPTQSVSNGQDALTHYQAMHEFVTTNDMSVPANYAKATTLLDPVSLATDWVQHLWALNLDWPGRNIHVWRSPALDRRWHWQPHDFDSSLGALPTGPNQLRRVIDNNAAYAVGGSELVNALLRNPDFRTLYLNTAADELSSRLTGPATQAVLDRQATLMAPYVQLSSQRWLGLPSSSTWSRDVASVRSWLGSRSATVDRELQAKFGVGARVPLGITVADPATGTVKVNSLDLTSALAASPRWVGGYYPQVPVTVTAIPRPGYVFRGWTGAVTSTDRTLTGPLTGPTELRAVFAPAASTPAPVVTAVGDRTDVVGEVLRLPLRATDPSGLPLTYAAKKLPSGLDLAVDQDGKAVVYGRFSKPDTDTTTLTVSNGVTSTVLTLTWTVVNPGR